MVRGPWLAASCTALAASLGCGPLEVSHGPPAAEPPLSRPRSPEVEGRSPEGPITLEKAVDIALSNYPAIRSARARIDAARAGESLARTAYLPRLDLLWQELRTTRNNISGVLF